MIACLYLHRITCLVADGGDDVDEEHADDDGGHEPS